ncbi:unnamed protein product, partial [Symbiodinium necroappetens]
ACGNLQRGGHLALRVMQFPAHRVLPFLLLPAWTSLRLLPVCPLPSGESSPVAVESS